MDSSGAVKVSCRVDTKQSNIIKHQPQPPKEKFVYKPRVQSDGSENLDELDDYSSNTSMMESTSRH